jgi:HAD superfamily hydrolase (TIGR01509 family)
MKFKAIVFDMDGTIVNTEPLWQKVTSQLITNQGYSLNNEQHQMLMHCLAGLDTSASCAIIKDLIKSDKSIATLVAEKKNIAQVMYQAGISFIEGFEDFHSRASALSLKTAIATNAHTETVQITEKHLKLTRYFGSHVYCIDHVHNIGKPNPDVYLHAAQKLLIAPQDCIAIEDSAHGIAAARAAGMFCIGINTSKRPEQIKDAHLQVDSYCQIDLVQLLK